MWQRQKCTSVGFVETGIIEDSVIKMVYLFSAIWKYSYSHLQGAQ